MRFLLPMRFYFSSSFLHRGLVLLFFFNSIDCRWVVEWDSGVYRSRVLFCGGVHWRFLAGWFLSRPVKKFEERRRRRVLNSWPVASALISSVFISCVCFIFRISILISMSFALLGNWCGAVVFRFALALCFYYLMARCSLFLVLASLHTFPSLSLCLCIICPFAHFLCLGFGLPKYRISSCTVLYIFDRICVDAFHMRLGFVRDV